jgi:hypothetical protein
MPTVIDGEPFVHVDCHGRKRRVEIGRDVVGDIVDGELVARVATTAIWVDGERFEHLLPSQVYVAAGQIGWPDAIRQHLDTLYGSNVPA